MTRADLELAAFWLNTYQRAHELAEARDPRRRRTRDEVRRLDRTIHEAAAAVLELTGRTAQEVNPWDLNTTNPAPWTRAVNR